MRKNNNLSKYGKKYILPTVIKNVLGLDLFNCLYFF